MYHNIVLFLLILSNVLNLILDRSGSAGGRTLIYVANGLAFVFIGYYLFKREFAFPKRYLPLELFITIFAFYFLLQYFSPNRFFELNVYVRWTMSLLLILFFHYYKSSKKTDILMKIYIITFIAECSYKIYLGSAFAYIEDINKKMGGDTASIGLALVAPLILYFFKNLKGYALYVVTLVFVLFSLRRTSILASLVVIPFIWPSVKKYLNKKYLIWGSIAAIIVLIRTWRFVGAKVVRRFLEYSSTTSDLSSYGSGRTEFWKFIYNKYVDNYNWFFGNGLGSVYETFTRFWRLNLTHAHNDILEILYTFGLVGLLLWLSFFYLSYRHVRRASAYEGKKLFYCALIVYFVVAVTSGALVRAEMFPMAIALPILMNTKVVKWNG